MFVGENGVGKTTILSFIVHVFKNLQRFHNRIPSDFKMIYQLDGTGYEDDIIIEKIEENIFVTIEGTKKLLLEFDANRRRYKRNKWKENTTYDDIKKYLPTNVIVSCFDVDYPNDYVSKYIGDRLIEFNRIGENYTNSGFGLHMSNGIISFYENYFFKNSELKNFFHSLGFEFLENIHVYRNFYQGDDIKWEILDTFYEEFGLNNWDEFLKSTEFKDKEAFIEYVFSDDYWKSYCKDIDDKEKNSDSKFEYNEKLNFKVFIKDKFFNLKLLYKLISERKIYINEFFIMKNNEKISINKMSTGEKIFICRLFFMLSSIKDNSLIILEEPEIHLNFSWIKQLRTVIKLLFSKYKVHFLISTHSNAFINSLFPQNILVLEGDIIKHPNFNTFLANEREINKKLFKNSSNTNIIENEILSMIDGATKEELEYIMENLEESYFKYMLFRRLNEIGDKDVESDK